MTKMSRGLGNWHVDLGNCAFPPLQPKYTSLCFRELQAQSLLPRGEVRTPAGFLRLLRVAPDFCCSLTLPVVCLSRMLFAGIVEWAFRSPYSTPGWAPNCINLEKAFRFLGLSIIYKIRWLIDHFLKPIRWYVNEYFLLLYLPISSSQPLKFSFLKLPLVACFVEYLLVCSPPSTWDANHMNSGLVGDSMWWASLYPPCPTKATQSFNSSWGYSEINKVFWA